MNNTLMLKLAAWAGLSLAATAASAACTATYTTRNDWATGFVVDVAVKNTGSAPVTGWKVQWAYNGTVTPISSTWGGNVVVSGNQVSIAADPALGALAAGHTAAAGLVLSFSGSRPVAGQLTVSGQGCDTASRPLYVDPQTTAANWVRSHPGDGRAGAIGSAIANQPTAKWFGEWSGDIRSAVDAHMSAAQAAGARAVVVAYNVPGRDCGQHSAGGSASATAYQDWIRGFAQGVGSRDAIVILEPDALPQLDCLSAADQQNRLSLLSYATSQFRQLAPNAFVYLDAGNSNWLHPSEAATRLQKAGVANARGFALNVSNYRTDGETVPYGQAVVGALKYAGLTKSFVIDTSRNGNGPLGTEWCDPAQRRIGVAPYVNGPTVDPEMGLWIKAPGESDGCAGPAGSFVPDVAYRLVYGY